MLLQEISFIIFTLYSLYNCNPLPNVPTKEDPTVTNTTTIALLKMLPLHLKSQTIEGHANPKSTLHRRYFKTKIRAKMIIAI